MGRKRYVGGQRKGGWWSKQAKLCQRFEVRFRFSLRKKLDRRVKKNIKPGKPKNYEKLKELKANYEANQHPIFLRVKLTLT